MSGNSGVVFSETSYGSIRAEFGRLHGNALLALGLMDVSKNLSEKDPVLIVVQYGTADEVVDELGFEGAALGIGKCAILRVREP